MAGGGEVKAASSSRPQLRNLHNSIVKKNVGIAVGVCILSAIAFRLAYCNPRKERVAEFYRNYDQTAAFERMRKAGLFVSAPADS